MRIGVGGSNSALADLHLCPLNFMDVDATDKGWEIKGRVVCSHILHSPALVLFGYLVMDGEAY